MNKKLLLLPLCMSLLFASCGVVHVLAISDNQSAAISSSCTNIQKSLKSIQYLDAKTRSYYGKYYEAILSDYMIPLGTRLLRNSELDPKLSDIQTKFTTARSQFNSDYIAYSQAYEELMATDCVAHPSGFYDELVTVRQKREVLSKDISDISGIIDSFRQSVKKLQESYGK